MQDYDVQMQPTEPMLLDALIRIRRSTTACRSPLLAARAYAAGRVEHQRQNGLSHYALVDLKRSAAAAAGAAVIREPIVTCRILQHTTGEAY